VMDPSPYVAVREFNLTDAPARRLGLEGQKQITWSYARTG